MELTKEEQYLLEKIDEVISACEDNRYDLENEIAELKERIEDQDKQLQELQERIAEVEKLVDD